MDSVQYLIIGFDGSASAVCDLRCPVLVDTEYQNYGIGIPETDAPARIDGWKPIQRLEDEENASNLTRMAATDSPWDGTTGVLVVHNRLLRRLEDQYEPDAQDNALAPIQLLDANSDRVALLVTPETARHLQAKLTRDLLRAGQRLIKESLVHDDPARDMLAHNLILRDAVSTAPTKELRLRALVLAGAGIRASYSSPDTDGDWADRLSNYFVTYVTTYFPDAERDYETYLERVDHALKACSYADEAPAAVDSEEENDFDLEALTHSLLPAGDDPAIQEVLLQRMTDEIASRLRVSRRVVSVAFLAAELERRGDAIGLPKAIPREKVCLLVCCIVLKLQCEDSHITFEAGTPSESPELVPFDLFNPSAVNRSKLLEHRPERLFVRRTA